MIVFSYCCGSVYSCYSSRAKVNTQSTLTIVVKVQCLVLLYDVDIIYQTFFVVIVGLSESCIPYAYTKLYL
jgi:hypothetical protein